MLIREDVQGGEIMEIKRVKLSEIRPYEKNPRRNDSAVDAVAASIKEFGWQQPIVVDKDGVIIAGHTRYKAAKKLKCKEVPVVYADNLTEEQVKAYRLADNKTSELAEWDFTGLNEQLDSILSIDMSLFGFDMESMLDFDECEKDMETGKTDIDELDTFQVSFAFDRKYKRDFDSFIRTNGKEKMKEAIMEVVKNART